MTQTKLTVPLLDLKLQHDRLREEVEPVLREVVMLKEDRQQLGNRA